MEKRPIRKRKRRRRPRQSWRDEVDSAMKRRWLGQQREIKVLVYEKETANVMKTLLYI